MKILLTNVVVVEGVVGDMGDVGVGDYELLEHNKDLDGEYYGNTGCGVFKWGVQN